MVLTDLQRDTVLVTDVAGRVEAALAEKWGLEGLDGLWNQIEALKRMRVRKGVIDILHELRKLRNMVIHHPRTCLPDYEKFKAKSERVLPLVERSSSAEDFAEKVRTHLGQDIEAFVDATFAAAFEELDRRLKQDVEAEIDGKLTAAFDELGQQFSPRKRS